MSRSGVSDNVIVNHLRRNGVARKLGTSDIISLHQQGVSELVINAMQSAPMVAAPEQVITPAPERVIVREHVHVVPRYHHPYRRHVYHYRVHPRWLMPRIVADPPCGA